MRFLSKLFLLLCCVNLLTACGGGGGGGSDDGNPAEVRIEVSPRKIDTADRTDVLIRIRDVKTRTIDGLLIKLRVPLGLVYREGTSVLMRDDLEDELIDAFVSTGLNERYILYFLSVNQFEITDDADITLTLAGRSAVDKEDIEIDVDRADVDNREGFNPETPRFTAQDSVEVEVVDEDRPNENEGDD